MPTSNRLYLIAVVALMIALTVVAFISELNAGARLDQIAALTSAQVRRGDVALYLRLIVDAESGQRGYLLTQDPSYLVPYDESRRQSAAVLERIVDGYLIGASPPSDAIRDNLNKLRELGSTKMGELAAALSLNESGHRQEATNLVLSNLGQRTMEDLRAVAAELDRHEEQRATAALAEWRSSRSFSRAITIGGTLLNLFLLALSAFLLNRDLRRRELIAQQQARHNEELSVLVHLRTEELSALSSHLQNLAEREKSAIARELHDELGGIMVAAKMDVAWLEKRLSTPDDELKGRWTKLRKLLDEGVDVKRRVVETLRPTLLDNMGLVPAVKWIYSETCARAGLRCTESYPDEELRLGDEAAIAVFRLVQESLVNIVKHAKASDVSLVLALVGENLKITIRDNGVGMLATTHARRTHGLASMRHRVSSFGGTWQAGSPPGGGTSIEVSLPLGRIMRSAVADDGGASA